MRMQRRAMALVLAGAVLLTASRGRANNLAVTNVTVSGIDSSTAHVQFDISWENSWRYTNINHDAAWVFFKVLPQGSNEWEHVTLQGTGENPAGYDTGSGTNIDLIVPDDRIGLFIRRADQGAGDMAVTGVEAVWNITSNGLTKADSVCMQAFGLEMVYVAQGAFELGSGGTEGGHFYEYTDGSQTTNTYTVGSEAAITTRTQNAHLWGTGGTSGFDAVSPFDPHTIPAGFPKGYDAFYCMKYEITQGQYADFLNTLTDEQDDDRRIHLEPNYATYRGTIGGSYTNYSAGAPDWACNFLSWADICAFADWAGLRPMTELEFEKACRGPLTPVPDEFPWGTTNITAQTGHANPALDGTGTETASPAGANCCYDNQMGGPVRVGIYATTNSSREAAGASYWGIMELGGNVWERPVTIGNTTGRLFTAVHGNGVLTADTADADAATWPETDAAGAGHRAGIWNNPSGIVHASDRSYANFTYSARTITGGGRVVRSAPSGVEP